MKLVKGLLIGMIFVVFFIGILGSLNVINLAGSFITPVMALSGIVQTLRLDPNNKVIMNIFKISFSALAATGLVFLFVEIDARVGAAMTHEHWRRRLSHSTGAFDA